MTKFKTLAFGALALAASALPAAAAGSRASRQKPSKEQFISSLMSRMTLDEKIGQLVLSDVHDATTGISDKTDIAGEIRAGKVGNVFNAKPQTIRLLQDIAVRQSRLGIPLLAGLDVIHGYHTAFPIPLAQSCSWDTTLVGRAARHAAEEATACGVNWTFSPMVDVAHDARWGRIAEGSGEDPFLGACFARAMVRGYQGDMSGRSNMAACVKHFALYGAVEAGADYNFVDMSRMRMFNEYLLPYQAAVEAGVMSVMPSFNVVDYVPSTGNKWLLGDVLRDKWGFKGFVVTDYNAMGEMRFHGMGTEERCAELAANAGVNLDMCSRLYTSHLRALVESGKVSGRTVDALCRSVLEAKWELGLFDDANRGYSEKEARKAENARGPEALATARQLARESIVLLKNDSDLLPLRKQGRIAVVGPLAKSGQTLYGCWMPGEGTRFPNLCVLDAIREAMEGKGQVAYARGSNVFDDPALEKAGFITGDIGRDKRSAQEMADEAVSLARSSDVVVAVLGEMAWMAGESQSRTDLEMPDAQRRLLEALLATGKPVVLLHMAGRPTIMKWENAHVPAIAEIWHGGSEAAHAAADVLFGDCNPSGKLTTTFPQSTGQLPFTYARYDGGRPANPDKGFQRYRCNYMDAGMAPVFPFGHGLSYTTYKYGPLALSAAHIKAGGSVRATVSVTNTGKRAGDEVVQLYIRDLAGSVVRPVKELKGFRRVHLEAGETKEVAFDVTERMLRFYNADLEFRSEPGDFEVMVGASSADTQKAGLTLD